MYYTLAGDSCLFGDIDDCDPGDICGFADSECYSGDPHGANLRDLVAKIAPVGMMNYVSTMLSSPCVRAYDNSYWYTGGYRND